MITDSEMREKLREAVGSNQSAFARRHKISEPYLSQVLSGQKAFGPKVARALGYVPVKMWKAQSS